MSEEPEIGDSQNNATMSRRAHSILLLAVSRYRSALVNAEEAIGRQSLLISIISMNAPFFFAGSAVMIFSALAPSWTWVATSLFVVFLLLWAPFTFVAYRALNRAYPPDYQTMAPIMMLIGAVFFGVGAYLLGTKVLELSDAVETPVTVVELEQKEDGKGEVKYRPVFEMIRSDGTRLRYADDLWRFPPLHEKGEVLAGKYSPSSGMVSSNKEIRSHLMFGSIFTLVGGVLLFAGVYFSRKQ